MSVIGICGGLLCAVADCLLDLKGADKRRYGWIYDTHFVCMMPTIYRDIMETSTFTLAEKVISHIFGQIYIPFFTLYCFLVILPAGIVIYAVVSGILPLPLWCVLLNPVVFQVIGWLLRATKLKCFIDAPGICAASLGLAMYGVLARILL